MTKLETVLSRKWIADLRINCHEHNERIKLVKIHGGAYQTMGVPDYLGWWTGYGLAIEFKADKNVLSPIQKDFLESIAATWNFAMVITFKKNKDIVHVPPRNTLLEAKTSLGEIFYKEVGY